MCHTNQTGLRCVFLDKANASKVGKRTLGEGLFRSSRNIAGISGQTHTAK